MSMLSVDELITTQGLKSWEEILKLAKTKVENEKKALEALEKEMVNVTFYLEDDAQDILKLDEEKRSDNMKVTVATKVSIKTLSKIINEDAPILVKKQTKVGWFDNVNGYCQTMAPLYRYAEVENKHLVGFELEGTKVRLCGYKLSDVLPITKNYFC